MAAGCARLSSGNSDGHKADRMPSVARTCTETLSRSPGRPLDSATRALFEPRFGHDFSRVRVHWDEIAARSARLLNASAYAVGEDLVFGQGQYSPSTDQGRALLAHELMHTLQRPEAPVHAASIDRSALQAEAQAREAASVLGMPRGVSGEPVRRPHVAYQEKPLDSGDEEKDVEDLGKRDLRAGTLITRIVVDLRRGRVAFDTNGGGRIFGSVSTDLKPGVYIIHPDFAKHEWVIDDPVVKVGLRFHVELEGATPWTLAYPDRLKLAVGLSEEWTQGPPPFDEFSFELQDEARATPSDEERHIDNFEDCSYSLDYKSEGGNASKWLTCYYTGGQHVDINLDWIHDGSTPGQDKPAALSQLKNLRVPSELTTITTPRLCAEKKRAINAMYEQVLVVMDYGMVAYSIASLASSIPVRNPGQQVRVPLRGPRGVAPRIDPHISVEVDQAFENLRGQAGKGGSGTKGGGARSELHVRVPVTKTGEPVDVMSVGAGRQQKSDMGVPEDVVNITKTDVDPAAAPDTVLDATKPIPKSEVGKHTVLFINNPFGYKPNIPELAKALKPGGKIIVQGNWRANKFFRSLGEMPVPEGMTRTIEQDVRPLGRGFKYTDPSRPGEPIPNARITFEFTAPASGGP